MSRIPAAACERPTTMEDAPEMKYVIDTRYRLRGWHGAPTGVYDTRTHEAHFVIPALYKLLMKCDAAQDIDPEALPEKEAKFLKELLAEKVVRPAGM